MLGAKIEFKPRPEQAWRPLYLASARPTFFMVVSFLGSALDEATRHTGLQEAQ